MPFAVPQTPAQAPNPPSVVGTGNVALPQNVSRPMTLADVQLLQNRRNELSRQLSSATDRRSQVVREMGRSTNGREGLDARLKVLDERIVQLEKDISQTGQLLASAPPNLVEETTPATNFPGPARSVNSTAISIVFTVLVLCPMALAWSRRMLRRPSAPAVVSLPPETALRLERIENAVDSIALEVERVSEGQRFVTRLMNESHQLGAGAAEPIVLRQGEKVPLERKDPA
jgi:hypothetical protein